MADPGQHTDNQLSDLRSWAELPGLEVVRVYQVEESAWRGAHQKQLTQSIEMPGRAGFRYCWYGLWTLGRLSREGPLAALEVVHRLGQFGVQVWSYQEPWTEAGGELLHPLLTIAGWIAMMESNRRSERTNTNSENRPHIKS